MKEESSAAMDRAASPSSNLADQAILGIDNVRLELPLAGVGSRILAATIDACLLGVLESLWLAGFALVAVTLEAATGWGLAILIFGVFALQWGYFTVLEIAMSGQTPGKRAIGLRVVAGNGGRASSGAIVVRGLLRSVDLLAGVPLMMFEPRGRRLGDLAAGTLVVHERHHALESERVCRLPTGWGAREVVLLEGFLCRAAELEAHQREALAGRLVACIERQDPAFAAAHPGGADRLSRLRVLLAAGRT